MDRSPDLTQCLRGGFSESHATFPASKYSKHLPSRITEFPRRLLCGKNYSPASTKSNELPMLEKGKLGEKKLLFAVLLLALLALTPAWTPNPSNAPSPAAYVVAFLNKHAGWYQQPTPQPHAWRE